MKKILILFMVLLAGALRLDAQNDAIVAYSYDADGNRISLNYTIIRVDEDKSVSDEYNADENNITEESCLSVYPNPTNGYLTLSSNFSNDMQNVEVKLYSLQGNIIENRVVTSNFMEFNLSDYPAGIYFLSVVRNDERQLWKIVKN